MGYNQELLFTPEGVRDTYGEECARKLAVRENIHKIMRMYGFKDIETPSFEFFDIFNRERGTVASKEMYKFFDRNNNTLVLRPDITPSIARCVAKYYKDEELQIRLCYVGNTFINNSSYQGRLKEICQVGAELMNDSTSDADGEIIALTIECLQKAGLKEFQIGIGHADFFQGLVEEAGLSEEETKQLKYLLENKNMFGIEQLLSGKNISKDLKELFIKLPEFFGGTDHFSFIRSKTKNERALKAVERLENLFEILDTYGLSDYATIDLGLLNHYNYYTGIIFKAYTYGTGEAIATGGRYDKLIEQFGKKASAVGVAIVLDQLMLALTRQNIPVELSGKESFILYRSANRKTAILLANFFREEGKSVFLMRKEAERDIAQYKEYGQKNGAGNIFYIESEDVIHVIDFMHQSDKIKSIADIMMKSID